MNLKKIKAFLTLFTLILPLEIKADDYHFLKSNLTSNSIEIYGVKLDGSSNLLNTYTSTNPDTPEYLLSDFSGGLVDQYEGKIYFSHNEYQTNEQGTSISSEHFWLSYDLINNEFEKTSLDNSYIIYPEGIKTMIRKKADGSVHIGENSAVFKEENGVEKFWATDASGQSIPINITNGSDLQINGVSVQGQIDTNKSNIKNLGEGVAGSTALTAALTSLPQTSKESKLSCGIGTGAYSSRYAVGFGCASKLNERVDVNAGGSYVFGGSKSYGGGTLDSGVVKAGFVFKLGELNKPTQISLNESNELKKEVKELRDKNDEIISQNQKLLAKLEKLENIALKFQSSPEMISISTKN